MLGPVSDTTDSDCQFNFQSFSSNTVRLAGNIHLFVDKISIDDMIQAGRKSFNPWGTLQYKVPIPYLRPRVLNKGQPAPGNCHFVPAPGDGPQYKFGKETKGKTQKNYSFGKNAKTTPVSYLSLVDWTKNKHGPTIVVNGKVERGTFIDKIYSSAKKFNYPGPNT